MKHLKLYEKFDEKPEFRKETTVEQFKTISKNWPNWWVPNRDFDPKKAELAYHVVRPDVLELINKSGEIMPMNSPKNLPEGIHPYKQRLYLCFDEKTLKDIVEMQMERYYESTKSLRVIVIDWQKYINIHNNLDVYIDNDFTYFEEEKGRYGSFYIKEAIPTKFIKEIKTRSIRV